VLKRTSESIYRGFEYLTRTMPSDDWKTVGPVVSGGADTRLSARH